MLDSLINMRSGPGYRDLSGIQKVNKLHEGRRCMLQKACHCAHGVCVAFACVTCKLGLCCSDDIRSVLVRLQVNHLCRFPISSRVKGEHSREVKACLWMPNDVKVMFCSLQDITKHVSAYTET